MPRYRENPLIVRFSMLCPGISQNTKHHHLTLYKGQIWEDKSYLELCNHNILNTVFDPNHLWYDDIMEQNGELYVPPISGNGWFLDDTIIPYHSEILQSFAELTNITNMTFHSNDTHYENLLEDVTYQIAIGGWRCDDKYHQEQCLPPHSYFPWYIWTKESF